MGAVTGFDAEHWPLARLFAVGYRTLVDGMHERLAARGWPDVRPSYGFVLLAARPPGIQAVDLAALLGVTKQAASKLVDSMQAADYVERLSHPSDGRAKTVVLTPRGSELLAAVETIYAELESDWAGILGVRRLATLRSDLSTVLRATHDGALPAVRP
jgi:DNA-binding MarR family transcriptional regulator